MDDAGAPAAHILVVDDIASNVELLERRLLRLGHRVHAAENGERALSALRQHAFDLVLLDITMPGIDGYQVLETIRADASLRHLPVVMVSAVDEVESVVRCLELGAEDYLTKPFNPLVLRARVEASLAKKRLRDGERERLRALERELEIGREIQAGFLPQVLPRIPGWEIDARFMPAREVAGDFYDAFTLGNGQVGLVVADVCDKGVGAALYMALFRSLLRAIATHASRGDAVERLLDSVTTTNDYIADAHDRAGMFATAFVAILDPDQGVLTYVNAGHDAPFVSLAGQLARLGPTGPALGLQAGMPFRVENLRLAHGDFLFAFTDGVTDAAIPERAVSDEELAAMLAGCGRPLDLLDAIGGRVLAADGQPWDDVTMLLLHRQP